MSKQICQIFVDNNPPLSLYQWQRGVVYFTL